MSFQGLSTLVYPITNNFPPRKYLADRDPTSNDFRNFVLFDEWINKINETIWVMVGKTATSGTWAEMGTPQIAIDSIDVDANTPPGTDPVLPDGSGLVTMTGGQVAAGVVGANVIRTDSLAANSLTIEIQRSAAVAASASVNNGVSHFNDNQFTVDGNGFVSLVGGSTAIDSVNVDASTPPGTDPVLASPTGEITVTGAQVAAGVVGANVIRTDSLAANTYTIEIQRSTSSAAPDSTKNGVSHYDSSIFTVDGTGFVSLVGGSVPPIQSVNVDAHTAPGTDPVVADGTGQITVTGGQVAAGTVGANVIRTDSLAANTYTIEIQRSTTSAAADSTKNGVSHYNSADFTVDADGFVSAVGTGMITWQTITASQTLVINNGYICISPGGALSLALPATATIGDIIEVTLDGATSWTITQVAGQQIRYNNLQTTLGATGTLGSTDQGNTIRMVAQTATKWNVISALGTLTVV